MRISDWSSDVCSSDLIEQDGHANFLTRLQRLLRKTEALYLGEKGSCLRWRHIEGGGSGHRFVGHILGDEDRHIPCAHGDLVRRMFRIEFPWHPRRDIGDRKSVV